MKRADVDFGSLKTATGRRHFPLLDGLRGVAAICVTISHGHYVFGSRQIIPHAYLAVDFFYLLSGFVISFAYADRLKDGLSLSAFLKNRAWRLYPLIALGALLATMPYVFDRALRAPTSISIVLLYGALAILSLPLIRGAPLGGGGSLVSPVNNPAWSLFFELAANLAFAPVARRRRPAVLAAIILITALVLVQGAHIEGSMNLGIVQRSFWWGFPRVVFSFFLGVAIHVANDKLRRNVSGHLCVPLFGVLVLTFLVPRGFHRAWIYDLACVMILYPVIVALSCRAPCASAATKLMERLGKISYPLYIIHWPVFILLNLVLAKTGPFRAHAGLAVATAVLTSAAAAWVALKIVDEPIQAWRKRRSSRQLVSA